MHKETKNYGVWPSPISAADVAAGALRLGQVSYGPDGKTLYWLEGRPAEGGRQVLVSRSVRGTLPVDITPAPYNVRSSAHEYGGGAYVIAATESGDTAFFSNFSDQQVYALEIAGGTIRQVTRQPGLRFADYQYDPRLARLLAVVEDHTGADEHELGDHPVEPINYIASLDKPTKQALVCEPMMLTCGYDFFAFPRLSQDGKRLAYMAWKHPSMPWDESVLFVAEVGSDGSLSNHRKVAGGADCSVFQPSWTADGSLLFVSDKSGFWQLQIIADWYTLEALPLLSHTQHPDYQQCEFGLPMWVFAQSTYAVTAPGKIVAACNKKGLWSLLELDYKVEGELGIEGTYTVDTSVRVFDAPFTEYAYITAGEGRVAMLAGSASLPNSVVELDLSSEQFETVKSAVAEDAMPDRDYLSAPRVVEFPTWQDRTAYAFYYPPQSRDYENPDGVPPLLVKCHGGPTGATSSLFALGLQYWTSRGFAVVDVNYGGSTGYGRAYRKRLNGHWGVVDVEDCRHVVQYLVAEGLADPARVAISGGSAGGFTVLSALTFTDTFSVGASHYGIGDLEALVRDTHKFESRYLDNLVAPYPFGKQIYQARSPLHHVDRLSCPVIFFQGLEDKVVPPNQAEAMVEALRKKKIHTVYIAYEGEQHGFRRAENIVRTLESELSFFLEVFGIT